MLSEQPAGRTWNSNTGLPASRASVRMEFGGMTRTTLKTLWFAGGGLLATWFAVTPTNAPSAQPAATSIAGASDSRKQSIDELTTQEARLRQHLDVLPPKPTARNP